MNADFFLQAAVKGVASVAMAALAWRWLVVRLGATARRRWGLVLLSFSLLAPWCPAVWHVEHDAPFGEINTASAPIFSAWPAVLGGLWLAGTGLWLAREMTGMMKLRRLIAEAQPWHGREIAFPAPVRLSRKIESPCVAGLFRPVLLLPPAAHAWDAETWRCVLDHEAHHLREGDLARRALGRLVTALYWWLPPAHWLVRQLELETEVGCDAAVIAAGTPVRRYAEVLLNLAAAPLSPALPMSEPSRLGERLRRMLSAPAGPRRTWPAALGLLALATVAASLSLCGWKPPHRQPASETPSLRDETALRLSADPFPGDSTR